MAVIAVHVRPSGGASSTPAPGPTVPVVPAPRCARWPGSPPASAVAELVIGTWVTGSGPHAGYSTALPATVWTPSRSPRCTPTGSSCWLVSRWRSSSRSPPPSVPRSGPPALRDHPGRRRVGPGLIGFVQYFTDLPIALVLVHMVGAVLITAFTARLVWSVRGPASELPLSSSAQPAAASR